jgi:hypothetical protein
MCLHVQGATNYCIAHGGGRRCTVEGCGRGARDKVIYVYYRTSTYIAG